MEIGEENHKNASSITIGWCAKTQNQNIYLIHWQAAAIFEDVGPLCTAGNKSLQKEENASNLGNQLYL